jgi:membrane protein insertase Oxa1/YidC/SpoIIIJ
MSNFEMIVEVLGWLASVLIVGSYGLNLWGKLKANSPLYVWANIIGGLFFVLNTYYHKAYPSMMVNIIWVVIAIGLLCKPLFVSKKKSA